MKRIALLGNPNSGKSTLFNALTGSTQFVGNWPGVTVEKKEGKTKINDEQVAVIDLPGIYSLSPYSNEEIISRDYLIKEKPEVVIDIVDATNIERNLYLTTQIVELDVPVIVALNMIDVVEKKGEKLSAKALSEQLGCPVIEISAVNKTGVKELKQAVNEVLNDSAEKNKCKFTYKDDVKDAISSIKKSLEDSSNQNIDNFVALKVLSADEKINEEVTVTQAVVDQASELRAKLEKTYDDDFETIIAEQRYDWIRSIIGSVIVKKRKEKVTLSDKIDKVLTNKFLGLPIFFGIIYLIYYICLNPNGIGKRLVGVTFDIVIKTMVWASTTLAELGVAPWLCSLVSDGIIFGVGIVVAFIPYLMTLFVFLAILEECGYMARVTFIMDRVFRRFGLSGKSFIPMLLGTGCTVQAIASTRTIENEKDRIMTIFLTPFMPCATMMPTVMLVVSLFVSEDASKSALVAPLVYLFAICFIIIGGIFLKNTMLKGDPAPFVMELPEYKLPRVKNILHFVWEKSVAFFRKAASIIFITTVIIWFLKYFNFAFQHVEIGESMLASIGRFLAPIFRPLGFGEWELVSAMLTGFVAKDNLLATLGIILGEEMITSSTLATLLPPASAISFLIFFILSSPCFASMGAMRKELGSAKLTAKAIGFQMSSAYVVALVVYQLINLFGHLVH